MRTKRFVIDNIEELNPAMLEYGVILSETHPEVEFQPGHKVPIESYLWYNFHLDIQPHTFVDYYQEKLGVIDEADAMLSISKWNQEVYDGTLPIVSFDRIITIGDLKFGVMHTDDPSGSIVMMNINMRFPHQLNIQAGSGGYRWQYLDQCSTPSDAELKNYFSLNKYQRDRFKKQW
jgi:hypothetical protein